MEISPGLRRDAGRYPGKTPKNKLSPSPPCAEEKGLGMRRRSGFITHPQPSLAPKPLSPPLVTAKIHPVGEHAKKRVQRLQ